MRDVSRALALSLSMALCATAAAGDTHPFGVRDMQSMQRLGDPEPSPDGKRIVFSVDTPDLEKNALDSDLYLVNVDGTGLRRLTSAEADDDDPTWSPDGRHVWFISKRSGTRQVWRLPIDGGEAEQITRLPIDVGTYRLSPDGSRLAVSLKVFPDCADLACTPKRLEERAAKKPTGQLYDTIMVRHFDTWLDGRRNHLFVMPSSGGAPIDIMKGMNADSPARLFGSPDEYTFTPDSRGLVFTAKDVGREEAWSTNFDLFLAPADGSSPPKRLTTNPAWDTRPVFSPDGRTLAYGAMARAGYEADRYQIMLRPWPEGPERRLAERWDRSPESLVWSADSKTLYTHANNLGNDGIFGIDVKSGEVKTLLSDGTVSPPAVAGDKLVFARAHLRSPNELYTVPKAGGKLTQITQINAQKLAQVRTGEPEQLSFDGWAGEKVYAWIVKPVDFDPKKKYPVAMMVHGGPQGSFGNNFHYRWNPQNFAGAGYVALMIDFHGSTGYGQAFTDAIRGDWGGKPLEDLQKGLNAALMRYPWMDGDRACALGGSYGGYMINWIAGAWPDRFRCLVNHAGSLDERLGYFDTEEQWFPEWENGGTPWEKPEAFEAHNPVTLVKNWKTPMLVTHGAKDFRVAETQGLSTFVALQRKGIPSRLLYFPDENHWVLKPQNSIQWYDVTIEWLDRWTRTDGK